MLDNNYIKDCYRNCYKLSDVNRVHSNLHNAISVSLMHKEIEYKEWDYLLSLNNTLRTYMKDKIIKARRQAQ